MALIYIPLISADGWEDCEQRLLRRCTSIILSSAIIFLTLLPRFARHAVVASSDQIYLRLSCPPFICVKSKTQM
jgi:hypothetical protein